MDSGNIQQINDALRNSFAAIKQDMMDLKSSINLQAHDARELKQAYDVLKGESVTSDKLNLVKIRIGELNESLKRIWGIEEQMKALEDKLVSKAFVNQQVDGVGIKINDLRSRIESFAKSYVSELQVKKLVEDINKELNSLRLSIEEAKSIKDTVKQRTLEKIAFKLNSKLEDLKGQFGLLSSEVRTGIDNLRVEQKNFISEKQITGLIGDVNQEFDKVKEVLHQNSNAIEQLRESVMGTERGIKNSIRRENEQMGSKINFLQDELNKLRAEPRKAPAVYSAPASAERASGKKTKGRKETAMPMPQIEIKQVPVRRMRKTKFFANLLIAVAFISLVLSIISFVVDNITFSDQMGVVAVATFVVGILLRFIVALRKRSSLDQD